MTTNGIIPAHEVDAARAYPIRELWARLGLPALPEHGNVRSSFRQDQKPTCEVGGAKNIVYDYGTGESMDTIALVRRVKGCGFAEAVAFILGRPVAGAVEARPADPLADLAARRRWTVAALLALGCVAKGREVHFPMRDHQGKVIGWRRRLGDNGKFKGGEKAKAVNGSHNGLLYPHPLPAGKILVVEGEADAAAALSAGWAAVVGTPGANPGRKCIGYLQRLLAGREVVLSPDPDAPGRQWLQMVGAALLNARCSVSFIPAIPGEDLDKRLFHHE